MPYGYSSGHLPYPAKPNGGSAASHLQTPRDQERMQEMQEEAERARAKAGYAIDFASYQKHVLGKPPIQEPGDQPAHQ